MGLLLRAALDWRVWAVLAVCAALSATHWKAYHSGMRSVQRDWDADKAERVLAQAAADESARLKARAAAIGYENDKAARVVRVVTVTMEVARALETAPAWRDAELPPGLRDSLASAAAVVAGEPDVPLPAAGAASAADERRSGGSLRGGSGWLGRLPGPTSGAGLGR